MLRGAAAGRQPDGGVGDRALPGKPAGPQGPQAGRDRGRAAQERPRQSAARQAAGRLERADEIIGLIAGARPSIVPERPAQQPKEIGRNRRECCDGNRGAHPRAHQVDAAQAALRGAVQGRRSTREDRRASAQAPRIHDRARESGRAVRIGPFGGGGRQDPR